MQQIEIKYIYSAGLLVSEKPVMMNTVLGSCVSVCLWDKSKKIGGMNHFMLPFWNGNGLASPKYGNIAMQQLIDKITGMSCKHEDLVAKVFGGARMLREQSAYFDIGRRNIDLAIRSLKDENIPVIASSTGGDKGRKIFFNTSTGEVLLKYL
jgi:chemotaxis protein CheD